MDIPHATNKKAYKLFHESHNDLISLREEDALWIDAATFDDGAFFVYNIILLIYFTNYSLLFHIGSNDDSQIIIILHTNNQQSEWHQSIHLSIWFHTVNSVWGFWNYNFFQIYWSKRTTQGLWSH